MINEIDIKRYEIQTKGRYAWEKFSDASYADRNYFDSTGTGFTAGLNDVASALIELDSRSSTVGQKQLDVVVIGHDGVDTVGVTCDYTESSFTGGAGNELSLTDKHIIIKNGFDGTGLNLVLNGNCEIDAHDIILTNITIVGIGINYIKCNGFMTLTNLTLSMGRYKILNSNYAISNINISLSIHDELEFVDSIFVNDLNINGNIILTNCKIAGNLLTSICISATNDIYINNSYIINQVQSTTGGIICKNSYIEQIKLPTGRIELYNSYINTFTDFLTSSTSIFSKNSIIRLRSTSSGVTEHILNINKYSILEIQPLSGSIFAGMPLRLTFGDGTAIADMKNSKIKITVEADTSEPVYSYLILKDNPNGAGTTFKNNVFEVGFGEKATFNLSGGATNILKRTGRTAGITDTANNYTTFNTNY